MDFELVVLNTLALGKVDEHKKMFQKSKKQQELASRPAFHAWFWT